MKIYKYMLKFSFSIIILLFLLTNQGFATSYYVSPSGDDTSDGSVAAPFKTIKKAASLVSAGDTIFISGGTYSEKNITPASSGGENAMVVFRPTPGTGDVIITHPATSSTDGTPVFQLSNKDYIRIEGFQFKNFEYGQASISMSNSEGNVIINNRFENLGNSGVESWDENSVVWVYKSIKNVISNNYFYNIYGDGVSINGQSACNNLVCYNTFLSFKGKKRSWGGDYLYSRAIDVQDMSDGNNVIAFNYAKDVIHHVWLDRDGSNNVILRNFGDTGSGTVFNESRCAYNIVQENISINMEVGYMSAYYETTGWTIEPRWVNNVAYNNETGFQIHKSERDEFRNNISFNNTQYNLIFTSEALSNAPHIFKNNLWYSTDKAKSIKFKGSAVSVADFQAAIEETGGLSTDPLFTDLTTGEEDFTLQASSPAKNAGDNGLDIGAYAVYPATEVGWDSSLPISDTLVNFSSFISDADWGEQVHITLKLNKASSKEISVDITPVAGDAVNGSDFSLSNTTVTFQPGEASKTITIDVTGNFEHTGLVAFSLTNAVNAQPGASNLRVLKINETPQLSAYAGEAQTIRDSDNSGDEEVVLDGSGSEDPDGSIESYTWANGDTEIATGINPTVTLPIGVHTITLTVADNDGNTDSDDVTITILKEAGVWLEAECGTVGSLWDIEADGDASNGKYVTIQPGNNSTGSAPSESPGLISYTFNVTESGTYTLYARVICPSSNDDSFWLKIDNSSYITWNNIASSSSWVWASFPTTFYLSTGSHTVTIGYREDGLLLDKLWVTNEGTDVTGFGSDADNCNGSAVGNELISDINIYPNPVSESLNITLPNPHCEVCLYSITGKLLYKQNNQSLKMNINMANYHPGIYIIKVSNQYQSITKKIIKE